MPTIVLSRRFALTTTLLLPLMLIACAEEEQGPLERAGEQADETIEELGEALEGEDEE